MTINASGQISVGGTTAGQSIELELGQSGSAQASFGDAALRGLAGIASGAISLSNFYGKSAAPVIGAQFGVFNTAGNAGGYKATARYDWQSEATGVGTSLLLGAAGGMGQGGGAFGNYTTGVFFGPGMASADLYTYSSNTTAVTGAIFAASGNIPLGASSGPVGVGLSNATAGFCGGGVTGNRYTYSSGTVTSCSPLGYSNSSGGGTSAGNSTFGLIYKGYFNNTVNKLTYASGTVAAGTSSATMQAIGANGSGNTTDGYFHTGNSVDKYNYASNTTSISSGTALQIDYSNTGAGVTGNATYAISYQPSNNSGGVSTPPTTRKFIYSSAVASYGTTLVILDPARWSSTAAGSSVPGGF